MASKTRTEFKCDHVGCNVKETVDGPGNEIPHGWSSATICYGDGVLRCGDNPANCSPILCPGHTKVLLGMFRA